MVIQYLFELHTNRWYCSLIFVFDEFLHFYTFSIKFYFTNFVKFLTLVLKNGNLIFILTLHKLIMIRFPCISPNDCRCYVVRLAM